MPSLDLFPSTYACTHTRYVPSWLCIWYCVIFIAVVTIGISHSCESRSNVMVMIDLLHYLCMLLQVCGKQCMNWLIIDQHFQHMVITWSCDGYRGLQMLCWIFTCGTLMTCGHLMTAHLLACSMDVGSGPEISENVFYHLVDRISVALIAYSSPWKWHLLLSVIDNNADDLVKYKYIDKSCVALHGYYEVYVIYQAVQPQGCSYWKISLNDLLM